MALVGQAATIVQFAGVDAYGLIKMITEAAQTVRRNKATCLQLARRAKMIGDLLHQLHAAQLMQQPETRNPVEQLEETLRRALLLVRSCQGRSYLYRCFMGGRHADELREVQSEITFYLQLFPLVSYVDTTLTWVRLLNKAAPDPSCKEAPMDYKVPGSKAQLLVPLDQCKEISMPPSHDSILQVSKDQIRDYKVPGSEAQLLVPLDQCKEISIPPSHDSILQVPSYMTSLEGPLSCT